MMTVASELKETPKVLDDPSVLKAISFLYYSIETCAEDNLKKTLRLCSNYMAAFIMRQLINQCLLDTSTLSNELQYYGTKFIVDYSSMPANGGTWDE